MSTLVEAGLMGAALAGGDRVDEGHDLGVVAGRPPQGDIDTALALDVGHLAVDQDLLGEGVDAAARDDLIDRGTGRQVLDEISEPPRLTNEEQLAEPGALARPDALRLSVTVTFMPGTRKQAWVARRQISSTSMTASGSRFQSGRTRSRAGFVLGDALGLDQAQTLREAAGAGRTVGELPGGALVEPENMGGTVAIDFRHELLRSALTTEAPTPCRPPDE